MKQDNHDKQLKKGKKYLYLFYLVYGPVTFAFLTGILIFDIPNIGIMLYKAELISFVAYYLLALFLIRSIHGVMLLQAFICLCAAIITLCSTLSLIIVHIPINNIYDRALNIPYPFNLDIAICVVIIYMAYMIRKAFELDVPYLQSTFRRIKRYNPYDATYTIYPTTKMMTIFRRKKTSISEHSPLYKKIHAKIDWALSYLLYFAYIFIPTSPYTLRGVGHGKPLSWILLVGGLFFALMFGLGVEMFFAFFLTFRRIEKQIGQPLRPIVKHT